MQRWREHLPPALQWTESTALEIPSEQIESSAIVLKADGIVYKMISVDLILTASLQTRYRYAEYLIWRPYIYKALHSEDSVTGYDLTGCEKAIMACTQWPITLPLFQERKRLLPHLFEYSHAFFGVLILLHICSFNKVLRPLLEAPETYTRVERSKTLLLEWLSDMKEIHPVANWGWQLIRLLYAQHPVVVKTTNLGLHPIPEDVEVT